MTMLKARPVTLKSLDDSEGEGIIEAIVATYDTDSIGDQIQPGAFTKSLEEWADSGQPIPFIWSHMHDSLDAYIGEVLEASETEEGLYVKAQLDMDDPHARKAYKLVKGGRVRNYSFAYDVRDYEQKDDTMLLKELGLYEVGPTLIGMNRETHTLTAKSVHAAMQPMNSMKSSQVLRPEDYPNLQLTWPLLKRGRVLSGTNENSLREAHAAIGKVLAQLDSDSDEEEPEGNDEEESSQSSEPEKRDEHASEKRDEPTPIDPPDEDLATELSIATIRSESA